jgi:hypothetical protein
MAKTGYVVSPSTIRDMERLKPIYKLPKKWQDRQQNRSKHRSAIEALAEALDVTPGYLLAGYDEKILRASCFWPVIEAGGITLQDSPDVVRRPSSFRNFLIDLPNTEKDLLDLPWHTYLNENAFALIFRLEKVFDRLEMLLVNEPPLIFWDDDDVAEWTSNMSLTEDDAAVFHSEFAQYREHFRNLALSGHKRYRVVLNRHTFMLWLRRKPVEGALRQIEMIQRFIRMPTFSLVLLNAEGRIDEAEVISCFERIPDSYDGTLAVQIEQTPPDGERIEYSVTPKPRGTSLTKKQRQRIDHAWERAVDDMAREAGRTATGVKTADATNYVLNLLRGELSGQSRAGGRL